jgi:hypothetical protein
MTYIFKQKLKITDLVALESKTYRILLYEPEEYLGTLYSKYLLSDEFEIMHCLNHQEIHEYLESFKPQLLIYNTDADTDFMHGRLILKKNPHIKIITTAYNIGHDDVKHLMSSGVLGHINRRFTRPSDLVVLTKTFLSKD